MTRLLALLLVTLPRRFREEYGGDVLDLFDRRRARLGGSRRAALGLWLRTALDILATAAAERLDACRRMDAFRSTDACRSRVADDDSNARRLPVSDRLSLDLRDALRRLAAAPAFTATSVLILAVGIGGSTAIFSVVDAFALRDRPYARPHELVHVYQDSDEGQPASSSYPTYVDVAAHDTLFAGVGAVMPEGTGTLLTPTGDAEVVQLEFATSTYFPVLGLRPSLGRWFDPSEDKPGAPPVAVLTWPAWQRRFNANPSIVGSTVHLSGTAVTIVGVGPANYSGFMPGLASEAWLSISALGPVGGPFRGRTLTRREDHWFQIVARLAPGRTLQQAQTAMSSLAERTGREFPETDRNQRLTVMSADGVRVHPAIDSVIYPTAGLNLLLAGLVIALVCSNLANLTLARGSARRRELAVRLAIGATRAQIARSITIESILLALAGGALGLLLASWAVKALSSWNAPVPYAASAAIAIDYRVMLFALGLSLLTGLAIGLLPAIRTTRTDVRSALHPDISLRRPRSIGLRGLLIAVQVAISVVLLAGGGILLRSMINALRVDPGFDPRPIALLATDAGQAGRRAPQAVQILLDLRERVAALPGVQSAALVTRPPLTAFGPSNTVVLDEHAAPSPSGSRTVEVRFAAVTPEYFRTLGIPLLRGRGFSDADRQGAERVAVVSETMARRFWGTLDAVGRRYRHEGDTSPWITIVGVVGDVIVEAPGESPRAFLYRPFAQGGYSQATVVARAAAEPGALLPAMRQALRSIDGLLPVIVARTMPDQIGRSLSIPRAAAIVLGGFGALAIVLACLGVYSVVAFSVSRRRTEMGVRMALGATGRQVTRMVVREMMTVVLGGVLAGAVLAALLTPALRRLLIGVQPLDAATFAAVVAMVSGVALVTTWLPARRAASADPAAVLRSE